MISMHIYSKVKQSNIANSQGILYSTHDVQFNIRLGIYLHTNRQHL